MYIIVTPTVKCILTALVACLLIINLLFHHILFYFMLYNFICPIKFIVVVEITAFSHLFFVCEDAV